MRNKRGLLHDEVFSKVLYEAMRTATIEQKLAFDERELKFFANEKAMHQFTTNASWDKLFIFWTKLGMSWTLLFAPTPDQITDGLFNAANQSAYPEKKKDLIDAMAKNKIFAVNSNDIMIKLMLLSQNSKTEAYNISLYAQNLSKRFTRYRHKGGFDDIVDNAADTVNDFSSLTLDILTSAGTLNGIFNVTMFEMSILLSLFEKRNSIMKFQDIQERIKMQSNKSMVTKNIDLLISKRLIIKDSGTSKAYQKHVSFMITSKGIANVMAYLRHLHKTT